MVNIKINDKPQLHMCDLCIGDFFIVPGVEGIFIKTSEISLNDYELDYNAVMVFNSNEKCNPGNHILIDHFTPVVLYLVTDISFKVG